jgi:hypothetical protein
MSTSTITGSSNQFVRLPNGTRALYDAYDYSLHHYLTDQSTSGVFSYKYNMWFSCSFNYHMYMYENSLGPYEDPNYRSQMKEVMETTADRCCPKDLIEMRQIEYNIHT